MCLIKTSTNLILKASIFICFVTTIFCSCISREVGNASTSAKTYLSKQYTLESKNISKHFDYPYFLDLKLTSLNKYINDSVLNLKNVSDTLSLKNKCNDSSVKENCITIDYNIINETKEYINILFYVEIHYPQKNFSTYTFKTVNYDIKSNSVIIYKDIFKANSLEKILNIINQEINNNINSGDMRYECFTVTLNDFKEAKNDFILQNQEIDFYFKDCVMCPSFVGSHNISIPKSRFKDLINTDFLTIIHKN